MFALAGLAVMCEFLHLNGKKVWIQKIELFKSEQATANGVDVSPLVCFIACFVVCAHLSLSLLSSSIQK